MSNASPLRLQQRVPLGDRHNVYFDGQFIGIENVLGKPCLLLSPLMMQQLFDFNRRVAGDFPMNLSPTTHEGANDP